MASLGIALLLALLLFIKRKVFWTQRLPNRRQEMACPPDFVSSEIFSEVTHFVIYFSAIFMKKLFIYFELFPSMKCYGDDTTPYNYNQIIGQKIVSKILSIVALALLICCPHSVHSPPCQSPEHRGRSSPCGPRLHCPKPNPNRSDLHHRYKSNKMEFRRGPYFPDTKPARSLTVFEPILKQFHENYLCHVMLNLTIGRYNERISRCNVCKTKKEERFV